MSGGIKIQTQPVCPDMYDRVKLAEQCSRICGAIKAVVRRCDSQNREQFCGKLSWAVQNPLNLEAAHIFPFYNLCLDGYDLPENI